MKNVTIFGQYTLVEDTCFEDFEVSIGFDEYGEIFYRFYSNIDMENTLLPSGYELYYKSLHDLNIDVLNTTRELIKNNDSNNNSLIKTLVDFSRELPKIYGILNAS